MSSLVTTNVVEKSTQISVTAARTSAGQAVPIGTVTFEVIVTNLSDLALEYNLNGGAWFRLPRFKSRRIQANLQNQTLRLRKGAEVAGAVTAQVTTLSNGGEYPSPGGVLFRTGGRTVLFGSSSMARHTETGNAGGIPRLALSAKGPFNVMNNMLRNRFTLVANLGVPGETTTQIHSRINSVLAAEPDIVWYHGGTNDIFMNGTAADAVFAKAKESMDILLANGIKVVVCGPQKWQSTDPDVSPAKFEQYFKYVNLLEAYARTNEGTLWMNWAEAVVDIATGDQKANAFEDTKHLSNLGAMLVAMKHYDKLDRFTSTVLARQDDQTNYMPDPYMLTSKAATAPVTGTIWDKANVVRQTGAATITCSMTGAPDGRGMAQRVQITGAANNDRINISVPTATFFPLVAVGEKIVLEADIFIASNTALRAFPLYMARNSGAMNVIGNGRDLNTTTNDKALPSGMPQMQLQTVVYEVPTGTTALDATVSLFFNGAGSADVYTWNWRLRKVPAAPVAVV